MKKLLMALIRFYQKRISPLKRPCCRFYPTCSSYALEAVRRFGALRGSWLALTRILRCNPLCHGGIEPVPETFSFVHPSQGKRALGGKYPRAEVPVSQRPADGKLEESLEPEGKDL